MDEDINWYQQVYKNNEYSSTDRNDHEKVTPFDWNLDLEMNEDFPMWENEMNIWLEAQKIQRGKK